MSELKNTLREGGKYMIHVNLYAALRRYLPTACRESGSIIIEAAEGGKVMDVMRQLGINPDEVQLVVVNGIDGDFSRTLSPGDRLSLFPQWLG
ncbi:MAG TPA: MoaD/ThiS family protein [Patescibacteria group bacterium]|nr:MoaD/ThiS family protein [Patescibacteria group bacterium]